MVVALIIKTGTKIKLTIAKNKSIRIINIATTTIINKICKDLTIPKFINLRIDSISAVARDIKSPVCS